MGDDPEAQALLAEAAAGWRPASGTRTTRPRPSPGGPTRRCWRSSLRWARPPPRRRGEGTFLCVARGVLYALDEGSGELRWAVRVGPEATDPPPVVKLPRAGGPGAEAAVVAADPGSRWTSPTRRSRSCGPNGAPDAVLNKLKGLAGQPLARGELAAAVGRALEPAEAAQFRKAVLKAAAVADPPAPDRPRPEDRQQLWSQPLPDAPAGPPVLIGTRAFVPLRDDDGTVYESTWRPASGSAGCGSGRPWPSAPRPRGRAPTWCTSRPRPGACSCSTRAPARRPAGRPRGACRRSRPGTCPGPSRCRPRSSSPGTAGTGRAVDAAGPGRRPGRHPAADGAARPDPGPDGGRAGARAGAGRGPGPAPARWVWFPPDCDGERLAVASDTGQFRLFGLNQPGNLDKPLFPSAGPDLRPSRPAGWWCGWPSPTSGWPPGVSCTAPSWCRRASPGSGSSRGRCGPGSGAAARGPARGRPHGVPGHPPAAASGGRALCFHLDTGEPRWERQLGLVPAAVAAQGNTFVLVDDEGGLAAVPADGSGPPVPLAPAPGTATGPTAVAADAKTLFAVTPVAGGKLRVRRVVDGQLVRAMKDGKPVDALDEVAPPTWPGRRRWSAEPAPAPGRRLVHRFRAGHRGGAAAALLAGPPWRGDRPAGGGFITPLGGAALATLDGTRKLSRWEWPADSTQWKDGGSWDVPGRPGRPRGAGAGGRAAGGRGHRRRGEWLLPADKMGPPFRRWQAGVGALPAGRPGRRRAAPGRGQGRGRLPDRTARRSRPSTRTGTSPCG